MTKKRTGTIGTVKGAGLLALILAASGQAPPTDVVSQQASVEQAQPQPPATKTAPTPVQAQRPVRVIRGGGRDPRQAFNPIRRARRRLEALGIISSGRQWRNFRKYARHNPVIAEFWARTLAGQV